MSDRLDRIFGGHDPADAVTVGQRDHTLSLGDILPRRPPWHRVAACRDAGVSMFPTSRRGVAEALAVCGRCPAVLLCRQAAIERGELHGVWGGLDEQALRSAVRLAIKAGTKRSRNPGEAA